MFTSLALLSVMNTGAMQVNKVDNNNYQIVAKKATTIKIQNSDKFDMILEGDNKEITNEDDTNNLMPKKIHIKKNTKYNLFVETGNDNASFKINNHTFNVDANQ